jgi:endonuclease/exonuclease/phosphatase family metal-dependent hydrolase
MFSSLSRRDVLVNAGSAVGAVAGGTVLGRPTDPDSSDATGAADEETLAACSFNVLHRRTKATHEWPSRRPRVVEALDRIGPALLGIQEARPGQFADLREALTGYEWYGRGRDGTDGSQATPVAWRSDRFDLRETGTFWLSSTPEKPSVGWGARVPRVVNWASLTDGRTGTDVWLCNAHVSYLDEKTRRNSAALLRERAAARAADGETVVLTVDLNAEADSPSYRTLAGGTELLDGGSDADTPLADARKASPQESVDGPADTYHGFADEPKKRYDYVFTPRPADVFGYRTLGIPRDGYRSDHLPVVARFRP